ncbi:MAG: hypothetical protein OEL20_04630 [Sulfuritalea sp.]|nr:hypothetical protein [Sulfuritalea sp.]
MGGLASAIAVGLFAPAIAWLVSGIVVIGVGMILAILFYLLRPVSTIASAAPLDRPTTAPADTPTHSRTSAGLSTVARRKAQVIRFPQNRI